MSRPNSRQTRGVLRSQTEGPHDALIRVAVPADAAVLTALARRAKAHWGYPSEWLDAWKHDLTITSAYIEHHRVFVACVDHVPVGVCAIEDCGQSWSLEHVWIDPSFQRRGVGKALVRKALDFVRETRPGVMIVESDPHAAEFYQRLGGRPAGTAPAPMPGAPERGLPLFEFRVAPHETGESTPERPER